MKIFLIWSQTFKSGINPNPELVVKNLQYLFAPLFSSPPKTKVIHNSSMTIIFLELPILGWKESFFQEDEQTWTFAIDYPINGQKALSSYENNVKPKNLLPKLARKLQTNPSEILKDMSPPFSLIWASKKSEVTYIQNDGLGLSQLFEYNANGLWAMSNKITAFKALDIPLEIDPEQWALRTTLGWFPMNMTGYQRISFLEPATQLRLYQNNISRKSFDILDKWLYATDLSPDNCLELARSSLIDQIKSITPLCSKATVGLSGGWDSRAIVSSLRHSGLNFYTRVRGLPGRPDVIIASKLAKIANFNLKHNKYGSLPPDDVESCRRCLSLALIWQAGYMVTHKHKTFLSRKLLDGGVVNIMGQHGEIGRGYYTKRIKAFTLNENQYEDKLIMKLMKKTPLFTKENLHDIIRQVIQQAYRQADKYGLVGCKRLDFFYLYERTRRWASGSLNSQTGLVFAPFLNPDYISAVFAYKPQNKETNPFHRHIIATNSPNWVNVPYAEEIKNNNPSHEIAESINGMEQKDLKYSDWKQPNGNDNYNSSLYWETVGKPIIEEALSQGGLWTKIFDPDKTIRKWQSAPDDLAILYLLQNVLNTN